MNSNTRKILDAIIKVCDDHYHYYTEDDDFITIDGMFDKDRLVQSIENAQKTMITAEMLVKKTLEQARREERNAKIMLESICFIAAVIIVLVVVVKWIR